MLALKLILQCGQFATLGFVLKGVLEPKHVRPSEVLHFGHLTKYNM
jgi:hypothetical protein